tara:strand:- start:128 stop:523 length:396 start_codon:yes stop_codon:yes gene_type:complete
MKRAMFVGRWQPFHNGHKQLIDKKLNKGTPVLVCVCDVPPDDENPFSTRETMHMIEVAYQDQDVIVMAVPDVESVNYGKDASYEVKQHATKKDKAVTISDVRSQIKEGTSDWKENIDPKIQGIVHSILLRN